MDTMKKALILLAAAVSLGAFYAYAQHGVSQVKTPTRALAPAAVSMPADIAAFIQQVGNAYGSPGYAELGNLLGSGFLYQGMDKDAFIRHLTVHQKYLGKLQITP